MSEDTVLVERTHKIWTARINRPERRNSIDKTLIGSLSRVLDEAERDSECKFVVLEGSGGLFCTGMDFEAVSESFLAGGASIGDQSDYMDLLKRFASIAKIIIAKVEGMVLAGGVGIVAASDLVISNRRGQFGLSEALWGLLPACVTPFLIRRVGFQMAYKMTLTTETIDAQEAWRIGLVDILSDNPADEVRRQLLRAGRLEERTILDLKRYFREMWLIDERIEQAAVSEAGRLINSPRVQRNISAYVERRQFPWET